MNSCARLSCFGFALARHLVGGHHVELPAGKLARQAHVLAAAADRLRSLSSATAISIECFSSSTMIDCTSAGAIALMTNCAGLSSTGHDVDALAVESFDTACTREPRMPMQAPIGSVRWSCASTAILARSPGSRAQRLDLDQALADFRHFELEQLHHEFRRGARDEQLRAAQFGAHFVRIAAQAIAGAPVRAGSVRRAARSLGVAAEIEKDVAALDALDDAGDQLADAILVRIDDLRALGFAHALHDDLLGGLRGDAAESGFSIGSSMKSADIDPASRRRASIRRSWRSGDSISTSRRQPLPSGGTFRSRRSCGRSRRARPTPRSRLLRGRSQRGFHRLEDDGFGTPFSLATASTTSKNSLLT